MIVAKTEFRLILLLFSFFSSYSMAQNADIKNRVSNRWLLSVGFNAIETQLGYPEEASWGMAYSTLNLGDKKDKSYSFSFMPKVFVTRNLIVRFEFRMTKFDLRINSNSKNTLPININYFLFDSKIEQRIYKYNPGIQWNIIKINRLDAFVGLNLSYCFFKKVNYQTTNETRNFNTDSLTQMSITKGYIPGGNAIGLGSFAGFNFYMLRFASIGIEVSSSLLYYSIGGHQTGVTTSYVSNQPTIKTEFQYASTTYTGVQFSKIICNFNICIRF